MKAIVYIIKELISTIKHDFSDAWKSFGRPKQVMNYWFILMVIFLATQEMLKVWITVGLYLLYYVWRIVKQGKWKHKMRLNYKH